MEEPQKEAVFMTIFSIPAMPQVDIANNAI